MSQSPQSEYTPDAEAFFMRVREALPSFARIDDAGRDDWADADGTLGYIRVAALAWHLRDLAARGDWDNVTRVLDIADATLDAADSLWTRAYGRWASRGSAERDPAVRRTSAPRGCPSGVATCVDTRLG